MVIEEINIQKLQANPVQPEKRITDSAVSALVDTILESGFIAPIIVCGNVIVDGHRRWKAALKIGPEKYSHLPCIQVSQNVATPSVWFIWLNRAMRNVKGNDWFSVWAHSSAASGGTRAQSLKRIPTKVKREIEEMVRIFGLSRAVELGRVGIQSPNVVVYIRSAISVLIGHEFISGTEAQITRVGEWMLTHKQTLIVKHLLREHPSHRQIEKLHNAIQLDRPLVEKSGKKFRKPRGKQVGEAS